MDIGRLTQLVEDLLDGKTVDVGELNGATIGRAEGENFIGVEIDGQIYFIEVTEG